MINCHYLSRKINTFLLTSLNICILGWPCNIQKLTFSWCPKFLGQNFLKQMVGQLFRTKYHKNLCAPWKSQHIIFLEQIWVTLIVYYNLYQLINLHRNTCIKATWYYFNICMCGYDNKIIMRFFLYYIYIL